MTEDMFDPEPRFSSGALLQPAGGGSCVNLGPWPGRGYRGYVAATHTLSSISRPSIPFPSTSNPLGAPQSETLWRKMVVFLSQGTQATFH